MIRKCEAKCKEAPLRNLSLSSSLAGLKTQEPDQISEISIIPSHYRKSTTSTPHLVPLEQALQQKNQDIMNEQQQQIFTNLLLTEDRMKLKLADFGMAWEKAAGEMKTCEASTYKWMASESYRKVPLECGRKKHYYQKVDVYSFPISVLGVHHTRECPACRQHLR